MRVRASAARLKVGDLALRRSNMIQAHIRRERWPGCRLGACILCTRRGAFGMTGKNWDRVPIDAQSIDAPLSRAAVFLVVTAASEPAALARVCSVLDGLDDLVKTVGFRDLSGRLSCIFGIGRRLWDRLHFEKRPQELK